MKEYRVILVYDLTFYLFVFHQKTSTFFRMKMSNKMEIQ